MIPGSASTVYRGLRGGMNRDTQECSEIELLRQVRNNRCERFDEPFDAAFNERLRETKVGKLSSAITATYTSHDNDFLLSAGSIEGQPKRPVGERFLSGWRLGALVSLLGAICVTLFNIIITIWVFQSPKHEIDGAIGILFRGRCSEVRRLNVWVHVLVNTLSTLLLCGSNYCMQVLSAPNRAELDHAHAQQHWLHIGVPNIRNLKRIAPKRKVVWFLLGLSSAPLHLLFNSVVFANLQANDYTVIPTTEDWLHGAVYDTSSLLDFTDDARKSFAAKFDTYRVNVSEQVMLNDGTTSLRYSNISTTQCFRIYNNRYLSEVGNVYLIQDSPTVWRNPSNWTLLRKDADKNFIWKFRTSGRFETYQPEDSDATFPFKSSPDVSSSASNGWMCASHTKGFCDTNNKYEVPRDKSKWAPYDRVVNYCIVEVVEGKNCKLQYSLPIAMIVILSNLVKVICMVITLFAFKHHAALVTIGDAVASFLEYEDQETLGRCLYSRHEVEADWDRKDANGDRAPRLQAKNMRYNPKRRLWLMAASQERWIWTYATYFIVFCFAVPSIYHSLQGMPSSASGLWKVGFGTVNGNNLMNISVSVFGGVLLANIPQALLSYLYLAYNALYTNLFVAHELSSYMHERKALRVTAPRGKQRDTYWLNVPFRYAIPMTVVFGMFHWLASQSIFGVQITVTDEQHFPRGQISTCGYSPMPIILAIIVATIIAGSGLVVARRRYKTGMPLASSCSAAISAACHPPEGGVDAQFLPVQWGAVSHGVREGEAEVVGHCSFSSWPVEIPMPGRLYA